MPRKNPHATKKQARRTGELGGHMSKKNVHAVALGRKGGKVTSDAKAAASRANGATGGRQKRVTLKPSAQPQEPPETQANTGT